MFSCDYSEFFHKSFFIEHLLRLLIFLQLKINADQISNKNLNMSEEKQEPLTVQDFKSFKICQYNLGHSSIPNLGHLRGE